MKSEELEAIIREKVDAQVTARMKQFGVSMSSVEFERGASGKESIRVKVYGENPVHNLNMARYLRSSALTQLGLNNNTDDGRDTPEPTSGQLGGGYNAPSPAAVVHGAQQAGQAGPEIEPGVQEGEFTDGSPEEDF